MKLVDLEQQIFVPVVDESKGGVTYGKRCAVCLEIACMVHLRAKPVIEKARGTMPRAFYGGSVWNFRRTENCFCLNNGARCISPEEER